MGWNCFAWKFSTQTAVIPNVSFSNPYHRIVPSAFTVKMLSENATNLTDDKSTLVQGNRARRTNLDRVLCRPMASLWVNIKIVDRSVEWSVVSGTYILVCVPGDIMSYLPTCIYDCTLNVQGLSYLGLTRSISWLLMPWFLSSPGH